jgi:hypothetical protein
MSAPIRDSKIWSGAWGGRSSVVPFMRAIGKVARVLLVSCSVLFATTFIVFAQTTVGTGSIVGTVSDPSGAVISGAEVTIHENLAPSLPPTLTLPD